MEFHLVLTIKPKRGAATIDPEVVWDATEWRTVSTWRRLRVDGNGREGVTRMRLYDAFPPRPLSPELIEARNRYLAVRAAQAANGITE